MKEEEAFIRPLDLICRGHKGEHYSMLYNRKLDEFYFVKDDTRNYLGIRMSEIYGGDRP